MSNTNTKRALLSRLEATCFFQLYGLLGDGNLRFHDWVKMAQQLDDEMADVWQFFLTGKALPSARVLKLLGEEALAFLKRHRLCQAATGNLSLGSLSLISYGGFPFFIDRRAKARTYFGEESRALMGLLPRLHGGSCLGLYPGCGAALLPVIATPGVGINVAEGLWDKRLLRANLSLHAQDRGFSMVDTSRQCPGGSFSLMVSSPPALFEVPGLPLPPQLAGGRDGFRCVRQMLKVARASLAPEGELVTTFLYFSDPDSKVMESSLSRALEFSQLDYRLIVSSKILMEVGTPVFGQIVTLAAIFNRIAPQRVVPRLARYAERNGLTAVYLLRGRFTQKQEPPHRTITNYADLYYGTWSF